MATARTDVPINNAAETRMRFPPVRRSLLLRCRHYAGATVAEEERAAGSARFLTPLLQDCYSLSDDSGEGQKLRRRTDDDWDAAVREEAIANDFSLLL